MGNYVAKLLYVVGIILLALLLINKYHLYILTWLIAYIVIGVICWKKPSSFLLFFLANVLVIIGGLLRVGLDTRLSQGLLVLMLIFAIAFIASSANIKRRKCYTCGSGGFPTKESVSGRSSVDKELGGLTEDTPKVEVYGEEKPKKKPAKKKAKKKPKKR